MTASAADARRLWGEDAAGAMRLPQRHSRIQDYALAIGLFLAALGARLALEDRLPPGFPYLTFFPAVVLATFFLGTGPGVLCATASGLAAWYFFLPPFGSFGLNWQTALALGFYIFIVAVDIYVIDRMVRATAALRDSRAAAEDLAKELDGLFVELQHRVGNNLAMVSAMLRAQSRSSADVGVKGALDAAARRIGVVADINRLFVKASAVESRFDDHFVRELAAKCVTANGADGRISVETKISPIALGQDRFLPLALTMVEAISNAIEHGFAEDEIGRIHIGGRPDGAHYVFEVADTGRGLPAGFDAGRTQSVGLMLVRTFATRLGGAFEMENNGGAVSRLTFPLAGSGGKERAARPGVVKGVVE